MADEKEGQGADEEQAANEQDQEETQEELDIDALANTLLESLTEEDEEEEDSEESEEGGEEEEESDRPSESPRDEVEAQQDTSPPSVSGDAAKLFSDPALQEQLQQWYRQQKAAEERQAEAQRQLEEIDKLIEEGNYAELGERVAKEWQEHKQKQTAGEEVLKAFLYQTYNQIFQDPIFQSLTDSDKAAIDPAKYGSDAEYIKALMDFKAEKLARAKLEQEVEKRVKERLEAMKNQAAADRVKSSSPSGIPSAKASAGDENKTGADLIREGFLELLNNE